MYGVTNVRSYQVTKDRHMQKFEKEAVPVYWTETCKMDLCYVLFIYLFNFAQPKYKTMYYIK